MANSAWSSRGYIERRITELRGTISRTLVIVQFTDNSVIDSFVGRKLRVATDLSVECKLEKHIDIDEVIALKFVRQLVLENPDAGIIVQLPLPTGWNTESFLELIADNDVDVLSPSVYSAWIERHYAGLPPVVYAVKTSLGECGITLADLISRGIVVCGSGKLVGKPVQDWLRMHNIRYSVIDITTAPDERAQLLKDADIIISGTGASHSIVPTDVSDGVVLIDCGTSSDAGVLQGDIHPDCVTKAQFMTRTPGGIGPLTVLGVFENMK